MTRSSRQYLLDLLRYVQAILDFTAAGEAAFIADFKAQLAVIRAFEIIGEIVKRLPDDLLTAHPQIEWQDIKAFRDFLAHNYDRVRLDIVWGAVQKLPHLKAAAEAMLSHLEPPSEDQ